MKRPLPTHQHSLGSLARASSGASLSVFILAVLPLAMLLGSCSDPSNQATGGSGANPAANDGAQSPSGQGSSGPLLRRDSDGVGESLGLTPWYPDFPVDVPFSPRAPGRVYDRPRRAALQRVVNNLQGNTTRDAWAMAKMFFSRAPEDSREMLVEALDRGLSQSGLQDLAVNVLDAMGTMEDKRFAPAIRRALENGNEAVRTAAATALSRSGDADSVRELSAVFYDLDARSQSAWIRAARTHLGEEAREFFEPLIARVVPPNILQNLVMEMREMPPALSAAIVENHWRGYKGPVRTEMAGFLHSNGDSAGTVELRAQLQSDSTQSILIVLEVLAGKHTPVAARSGELLAEVLQATLHLDPKVRILASAVLADVPGDNVTRQLDVLAEDPVFEVSGTALRVLRERGEPAAADRLLEDAKTATGSRVRDLIEKLHVSRDPRSLPILEQRFDESASGEGRAFLRAIAFSRLPEAFGPLSRAFAGPERAVELGSEHVRVKTTLNYVPVLMPNVEGADDQMVEFFKGLPETDIERRGRMLDVLGQVAALREADGEPVALRNELRAVLFDRSQAPQLRLVALRYLRRGITLDDAMTLRDGLAEEAVGMRKALSDFLFEFF